MMKLTFCEQEQGLCIGTKYTELIPTVGAHVVFVDEQGVRQRGTVEQLTFNYTTSYGTKFGSAQEDTVFARLSNVQNYEIVLEEKRQAFRAAL